MISNKLLKKKILDSAIHGTLIPNDSSLKAVDIEEIKENIPFKIPSNWKWVKISHVVKMEAGGTPSRANKSYWQYGTIPFVKIGDMSKKYVNSTQECITETGLKNSSAKLFDKGTILYSIFASIGITSILNIQACTNQAILGVVPKNINLITNDYLYYILLGISDYLKSLGKGTSQININQKILKNSLIPLPPLEEQEKIVNKIDMLFDLIDKNEKNDKEKNKLKEILKEKILDKAINGNLVNQINGESAEHLIKSIKLKQEHLIKIRELKRDNKIVLKHPDTFIPKGWSWVRLGDLGVYKKGPFGSSLTKDMFVDDGPTSYKVYEQKNAIQKNWKLGNYFISEEKFKSMNSFIVKPKDIIVSCAGTIGEIYVIPEKARIGIINQALMKISLFDEKIKDYFLIYFEHVLKNEAKEKGKGTAITNIPPFDVLKNIYIPLPPLEEQKRIVEKIESLFALIDQL